MPSCRRCGDEVDELFAVKVAGKSVKLCEDCREQAEQEQAVAEESEAVVQKMMDFKGRR
jgi:ribosome-binding protein aMBF1 (putative translation factor)